MLYNTFGPSSLNEVGMADEHILDSFHECIGILPLWHQMTKISSDDEFRILIDCN